VLKSDMSPAATNPPGFVVLVTVVLSFFDV
jgi:hypothetical protein